MPKSSAALRKKLVEDLEKRSAIKTDSVRRAFLSVPRELFVPEIVEKEGLEHIYKNVALVTKKDSRGAAISSSSEPAIMVRMLEELKLTPGLKVLEIGTGTGYNAALLKKLVGKNGEVVTVDLEPELVAMAKARLKGAGHRVRVVNGDGKKGWSSGAPYDRIIVTASSRGIPEAWVRQLSGNGLLVLPLSLAESGSWPQAVVTLQRKNGRLFSVSVIQGGFMSLRRKPGDPSPELTDSVYAGARIQNKTVSYGYLSGHALSRMSNSAKKRLITLLGSEPRIQRIEGRPRRYDFEVFLCLVTDPNDLVWLSRPHGASNLAIVTKEGTSLAFFGGGKRFFTRIESLGDLKAPRVLTRAVDEWIKLGRPRLKDLRVDVTFDRPMAGSWRWWREGRSYLSFNWDQPSQ